MTNLIHNIDGDDIYVVCYQGGTGGSFVSGAINSVLFGSEFMLDPQLGHCHFNNFGKLPNQKINDSVKSFEHEIFHIKATDYSLARVFSGHYRNLVAIRSAIVEQLGDRMMNNIKFVKISADHTCSKQVFFAASMLSNKTSQLHGLAFDQFKDRVEDMVESWYWIENAFTRHTTINLSIEDVFTQGSVAKKMVNYLTDDELDEFNQLHDQYLQVQRHLYPDVMAIMA